MNDKSDCDAVEVPVDDLPSNPDDVTDALLLEFAPLKLWLDFAAAYYRQGNHAGFKKVLKESFQEDAMRAYAGAEHQPARIGIYCARAAYHTIKMSQTTDAAKKQKHLEKATENIKAATDLNLQDSNVWLTKGLVMQAKNDVASAEQFFQNAISCDNEGKNCAALLGRAVTCYHREEFKQALQFFQKALKMNPDLPAHVRFGVGLCHAKLGDFKMAESAFKRVIALDSSNVLAKVALATIELNAGHIPEAMELVKTAYALDPYSPPVLCKLADHFFFTKDYDRLEEVVNRALAECQSGELKAECYYQLARMYHVKNNMTQAYAQFKLAITNNPNHVLAQFGMGQMLISRGEKEKALTYFEKIHTQFPNDFDCLRILGSLYSASADKSKVAKGRALLEAATAQSKNNVELLVELGQACERTHPQRAYEAYKRVSEVMKTNTPPSVWNNLGVMSYRLGRLVEANNYYEKALGTDPATTKLAPNQVTTYYNKGLLMEADTKNTQALEIYERILKEYPDYKDGLVAKGFIEWRKGNTTEALRLFEETFKGATTVQLQLHAHSLIGALQLALGRLDEAETHFIAILAEHPNDAYSNLQIGNICAERALLFKRVEGKEPKPKGASMTEASKKFQEVLKQDPTNTFAVNGLGVVLANWGSLNEAKDLFNMAKEAHPTGAFLTNLGHVHLALGLNESAIKMYEMTLEKFLQDEPRIRLYLARAYFLSQKLLECKKELIMAIRNSPADDTLWYNLAITQEEYAIIILRKSAPDKTYEEVVAAVSELESASVTFGRLSKSTNNEVRGRAGKHATFCTNSLPTAKQHLAYAQVRQQTSKDIEARSLIARQEELDRQANAKLAAQQREQEEKARIELLAAQAAERLKKLSEAWQEEKLAEERAREEKQRQEFDEDGNPRPKKARRERKKREEDDLFGEESGASDGADNGEEKSSRKRGGDKETKRKRKEGRKEKRDKRDKRKKRKKPRGDEENAEDAPQEETGQQDGEEEGGEPRSGEEGQEGGEQEENQEAGEESQEGGETQEGGEEAQEGVDEEAQEGVEEEAQEGVEEEAQEGGEEAQGEEAQGGEEAQEGGEEEGAAEPENTDGSAETADSADAVGTEEQPEEAEEDEDQGPKKRKRIVQEDDEDAD